MPNLKAKIDGHDKKIFENTPPPKIKKRKLPNEGSMSHWKYFILF